MAAWHKLSAGRPCELKGSITPGLKSEKGPASGAETTLRAVWVPALAGTTLYI
jgi:hypothetical protein